MKKHIFSRLKADERGQVLLIALVFMLLGGLIVTPLLSHMSTGLKTEKEVYEKRMDELYAADAGVEDALCQLQQTTPDPNKVPTTAGQAKTYGYGTAYPLADINGRHVTVEIYMLDSTTYKITSTAMLNSSTTSIVSYVSIIRGGGLLFNNAVATLGGDVNLSGGVQVISDPRAAQAADVFSSQNLTMQGQARIEGNATAKGTISIGSNAAVTGNITSHSAQSPGQLTQDQINTIVQDVKDETNIPPLTPVGSPVSSMSISGVGQPSSYYHYTTAINVTGDITFSDTNYVVFDQQVCAGSMTFSGSGEYVTFNGAVSVVGSVTSTASGGTINFNNTLTAGSITNSGGCAVNFNNSIKVLGALNNTGKNVSFGSGIYVGGDLTLGGGSGINLNSDVYVGGNMTLSGGTKFIGPKKVVVQGATVQLAGGTELTTSQLPFLLAPNAATLSLSGGATVSAVLYAPQAAASNAGSTSLYGAVIAKSFTYGGNTYITYPTYLSSRTDLPSVDGSGRPRVITWDITTQ
jgi:cytoskeletal protein CcmA (bactofilin family)